MDLEAAQADGLRRMMSSLTSVLSDAEASMQVSCAAGTPGDPCCDVCVRCRDPRHASLQECTTHFLTCRVTSGLAAQSFAMFHHKCGSAAA